MTLGEAKERLKILLDESNPKSDLTNKFNRLLDAAQKEVALYYPVYKTQAYAAGADKTLPTDCYRPRQVILDDVWHAYSSVESLPDEAFTLRYESKMTDITNSTSDTVEFDLPDEAVLALIYWVAAQCQSVEYDRRYFETFMAEYSSKVASLEAKGPAAVVEVSEDVV